MPKSVASYRSHDTSHASRPPTTRRAEAVRQKPSVTPTAMLKLVILLHHSRLDTFPRRTRTPTYEAAGCLAHS
jgi:hypothetical protein